MKKILAIIVLISTLGLNLNFIANVSASSEYDTYFVVSAYYSPLPNQKYYLKGDYEKEIRLNGKGISGASGKGVFAGMLAAPKAYKFGTKIKLEGLGIGSVEDRGGAIVPAGVRGYSYDRIDVWMGYGDEGLKRALTWGKRTVKGKIISRNTETNLNISKQPALDSSVRRLTLQDNRIFRVGIGIKSSNSDIINLQSFLTKIGLYKGEITGKYDKLTIHTVYDFQKKYNIINSKYKYGAGYWGKATRQKITTMYSNGDFNPNKSSNNTNNQTNSLFTYNIGDESSESKIKELQEIFKILGLYKGKINGNYNNIENVVISYQLKNNLIKHESNRGAGYFGPKTRKVAEKDYKIALEKIEDKKDELVKIENIKKDVIKKIDNHIAQIGNPRKGEIGVHVRILQKTLKTLGHFKVKDSAIFGSVTERSILSYQLEKGIVKDKYNSGAGIYGPATKESIKKDLIEKLIKLRVKEDKLVVMK